MYQLFVRLFGNDNTTNTPSGTLATNGSGKLSAIDTAAINHIKQLGMTHVWLTGVIRHATLTAHPEVSLPGDDPDIVKGRAGSPYAITDYYDIDPDLADVPANRITEFENTVARLHAAGLKVMIDFVPNHVSRGYSSTIKPQTSFGISDDKSAFFTPNNNFFYLTTPAGQSLTLSSPAGWNPGGLDGKFGPEDGAAGHVPRATGNNVTSPSPSATDWYETVKLNYGFNFAANTTAYNPRPAVWDLMDAIIAYWQDKGVDGFRCDFSHFVPLEFWTYATGKARERDPNVFFIAEAYDNDDGTAQAGSAPGTVPHALATTGGFNAVYDHKSFNLTRKIGAGPSWANDLDAVRAGDDVLNKYSRYIENHDERRAASPLVPNGGPGDTGFGTAEAGYAYAAALYLSSPAPIVLYAGQEVGEPGAGAEGFGGDDGRSTIFDYWSPPKLHALHVAGYDANQLTASDKALVTKYRSLIAASNEPEIRGGAYYGLNSFNKDDPATGAAFGANGHWMYAFLRYLPGDGAVLVVVNLSSTSSYSPSVKIPAAAITLAALPASGSISVDPVLGGTASTTTASALSSTGLSLSIPASSVIAVRLH